MRDNRSGAQRAPTAHRAAWLAIPLAALLAACGGGGSDTSTPITVSSVTVMGDSLADSGTFGYKFTVQKMTAAGAIDLVTPRVYPELIANLYGFASLCSHYAATSATTFVANPKPGCTNYAIGGGRINNVTAPTSPVSIPVQLANAAAAGNYGANDMLIIDGGGNDAADLIGAYLAAATDGGASYAGLLGSLLPAATVGAALTGGAQTQAAIGGTYMTTLADTFYASITTNALNKGAKRVVVLNMPGITNTPRFQAVLAQIAAVSGGGATGAAAAAQAAGLFGSWIVAFNTELAAKAAGDARVVLVDFFTNFNAQVAAPAQYGLQNATTPACPQTGTDTSMLATYTFPACTDVALTAQTPPTGATGGANWWQTYGFADSFHPTPQGHKNLAQLISRSLGQAGWL
ncbi:MAG TPA: SGNH/GDSL hydrolase family protein [Burkholderiaceae bacterium]|jgi:phospholipase/lecithinase/hemolysin